MSSTRIALQLALIGTVLVTAKVGRYKFWKAIQIENEAEQFTPLLLQLHQRREIEFYNSPYHVKAKIICPLSSCGNVLKELQEQFASYNIIQHDFDDFVNTHKAKSLSESFTEKYHPFKDIIEKLENLARSDSRMKLFTIGQSFQGRNITLVKISYAEDTDTNSRPVIFYECGIHAREWISPAACMGVLMKLLTERRNFMNIFDVFMIPVLNPDGYHYSFEVDRFWRKNRAKLSSANSSRNCFGVDLNRNFETSYGTIDTSDDPCSEVTRGETVFDQLESQALRDLVLTVHQQRTIVAYFTVHSYGQLFVYPSAYMFNDTNDYLGMDQLSKLAVNAIREKTETVYTPGNVASVLGLSAGASDDWAFEKAGIKTVFCIELRDTGEFNFVLPPDQISGAIEDLWTGTSTVLDDLAGPRKLPASRQSGIMSMAQEPIAAGILLVIAFALFFI